MKIYHYPNCSTCRKALKFLDSRNAEYEQINIVENPPSMAELESMLQAYDGQIRKLFNTSGMQYRELNLKDKLPSMSASEAMSLLQTNGMLVKRPFLVIGNGGAVGFKQEQWESLLNS